MIVEDILKNTDEESIIISNETDIFSKFETVVKNFGDNYSIAEARGIIDTYDENTITHYVFLIQGGNNGKPDWIDYLEKLKELFVLLNYEFTDSWLIKIDNDCLDDVHDIYIGIEE